MSNDPSRTGASAYLGLLARETTVPIFSPWTARAMLPSSSPKITIGSALSRARLIAVASATRRPRARKSSYDSWSNFTASGFFFGSESYTPSTPCLPISSASAPISSARWAATVSVEKYGMPEPAPKITTRPFSRCRSALRGMYGSATWPIVMAVCTRVSMPSFSRKSCSARQFITVPSMPM